MYKTLSTNPNKGSRSEEQKQETGNWWILSGEGKQKSLHNFKGCFLTLPNQQWKQKWKLALLERTIWLRGLGLNLGVHQYKKRQNKKDTRSDWMTFTRVSPWFTVTRVKAKVMIWQMTSGVPLTQCYHEAGLNRAWHLSISAFGGRESLQLQLLTWQTHRKLLVKLRY